MPPWARYLATAMALAGIGVCVYFLFYAAPIMVAWFGHLLGGPPVQAQVRGLVTFVGVASTLGTLVLLVGLALILVILKRLWLPGPGERPKGARRGGARRPD